MNAYYKMWYSLLKVAIDIQNWSMDMWLSYPEDDLMAISKMLFIKQLSEDGKWFRLNIHPVEFGWIPVDPSEDPQIKKKDEVIAGDTVLPTLLDFKRYESWVEHIIVGLKYPRDFTDETF